MPKTHDLDLLRNATDSLDEAISYYCKAVEDESKYKFCLILFFHFAELLLKHLVETINPLLCFERPHSERIQTEKTISWRQAIQVLVNSKFHVDPTFVDRMKKLSEVRNAIVHSKFSYSTSEIRKLVLDLLEGIHKLHRNVKSVALDDFVSGAAREFFKSIGDEYKRDLHLAQQEAREEADEEECENCGLCGEELTAVRRTSENDSEVVFCHFCGEEDSEVECARCCEPYLLSEMNDYGENEFGDNLYFCDSCDEYVTRD